MPPYEAHVSEERGLSQREDGDFLQERESLVSHLF